MTDSGERLSEGTDAYDAIQRRVDMLYAEHGRDIEKWPAPEAIFKEFESMLQKHGANRKSKCRTLYHRLRKRKFDNPGQFYLFYFDSPLAYFCCVHLTSICSFAFRRE